MMTAIMRDAKQFFASRGLAQSSSIPVSELMYADDALIVGAKE